MKVVIGALIYGVVNGAFNSESLINIIVANSCYIAVLFQIFFFYFSKKSVLQELIEKNKQQNV